MTIFMSLTITETPGELEIHAAVLSGAQMCSHMLFFMHN